MKIVELKKHIYPKEKIRVFILNDNICKIGFAKYGEIKINEDNFIFYDSIKKFKSKRENLKKSMRISSGLGDKVNSLLIN